MIKMYKIRSGKLWKMKNDLQRPKPCKSFGVWRSFFCFGSNSDPKLLKLSAVDS